MSRRSARTPAASAAETPAAPSRDNIFKDIFKDNEDHAAAARLWLGNQDRFPSKQAFLRSHLQAPNASRSDLNRWCKSLTRALKKLIDAPAGNDVTVDNESNAESPPTSSAPSQPDSDAAAGAAVLRALQATPAATSEGPGRLAQCDNCGAWRP
jgi:hypothetical protein